MKTPEAIQQLADERYPCIENSPIFNAGQMECRKIFIEGYTAAQEEIKGLIRPAVSNQWFYKEHIDGDDFSWEITNGRISICSNDDTEDHIPKAIVNLLNNSGCRFYSNNALELEQHIEIMELQYKVKQVVFEAWKEKCEQRGCNFNNALTSELMTQEFENWYNKKYNV